jgi:hypothetical protein
MLFFLESKVPLEVVKKFRKKELVKDAILNHLGNLLEQIKIIFLAKCLVFIVLPLVLKMILNSSFEVKVDRIILVKPLDDPKELAQAIPIVETPIKLFDLVDHLDELAHDKRKDGDSKQEHDGPEDSFEVAHRVVVSEADCCKTCKREVHRDDGLVLRGMGLDVEPSEEKVFFIVVDMSFGIVLAMMQTLDYSAHDQPSHTDEVAKVYYHVY